MKTILGILAATFLTLTLGGAAQAGHEQYRRDNDRHDRREYRDYDRRHRDYDDYCRDRDCYRDYECEYYWDWYYGDRDHDRDRDRGHGPVIRPLGR